MKHEQLKSNPGPWNISDHFGEGKHDGHIITDANSHLVCRIWHSRPPFPRDDSRDDANTLLIASAPELVNACRLALLDLKKLCEITGNDITTTLSWQALNKVIAEVEGRMNDHV